MSSNFDPYRDWLGIESEQQPPHHYELLGIKPLTTELSDIEAGYHAQYATVRKYQVGEHSAAALAILQQLSKAFDCLSDEHAKTEYDQQLRTQLYGGLTLPKATSPPGKTDSSAATDKPLAAEPVEKLEPLVGASVQDEYDLAPESTDKALRPLSEAKPTSDEPVWFYTSSGLQLGPVTRAELEAAVDRGELAADSEVWKKNWAKRRRAVTLFHQLEELKLAPAEDRTASSGGSAAAPIVRKRSSRGSLPLGIAVLSVALVVGFALIVFAMIVGSFGTGSMLAIVLASLGIVGLGVGMVAWPMIALSPLGQSLQGSLGNATARRLMIALSSLLLVIGYGIVAGGAVVTLGKQLVNLDTETGPDIEPEPSASGLGQTTSPTGPGGSLAAPTKLHWVLRAPAELGGFAETVEFSEDGRYLAVAGRAAIGNRAALFNVNDGSKTHQLNPHARAIVDVAIRPQADYLATASQDGAVQIGAISETRRQSSRNSVHGQSVNGVDFHPNGRTLASCGDDNFVRLWNVPDLNRPRTSSKKAAGRYLTVSFSPNGRILAAGSVGEVHLLDATTLQPLREPLPGKSVEYSSLAFTSDSATLLAAGTGGPVTKWSLTGNDDVPTYIDVGQDNATSLALSPDDQRLAVGTRGKVVLVHLPSGEVTGEIESGSLVADVAFCRATRPNEYLLAVASQAQARIWVGRTSSDPPPAASQVATNVPREPMPGRGNAGPAGARPPFGGTPNRPPFNNGPRRFGPGSPGFNRGGPNRPGPANRGGNAGNRNQGNSNRGNRNPGNGNRGNSNNGTGQNSAAPAALSVEEALADLRSGNIALVARASSALSRMTPTDEQREEVISALLEVCENPRTPALVVAGALRKWVRDDDVQRIVRTLQTSGNRQLVQVLREIKTDDSAKALVALLADPDYRRDATSALQGVGPVAEVRVLPLLNSGDADLREAAVSVLGRIGGPRSVSPLTALMRRTNDTIQQFRIKSAVDQIQRRMKSN